MSVLQLSTTLYCNKNYNLEIQKSLCKDKPCEKLIAVSRYFATVKPGMTLYIPPATGPLSLCKLTKI